MRSALFAAALFVASTSSAMARDLTLIGLDGRAMTVTAAEIAALPRTRVTFASHGESHDYEGPLLIDVLARAGAPTGEALRGRALADIALVESSDGYAVAFGLAEADPNTRANRMILADRADGAALSARDGLFRVIVEGDLRPARSARMVSKITLVRLGGATAAPAHVHERSRKSP